MIVFFNYYIEIIINKMLNYYKSQFEDFIIRIVINKKYFC